MHNLCELLCIQNVNAIVWSNSYYAIKIWAHTDIQNVLKCQIPK